MNKVIMIGNLTKDPEVRYTTGENKMAVANISIAVSRRVKRKDGPEADFFNAVAFGKTAEFIEKYFRKGMRAGIVGRIENESWTDKDGNKRTGTKIQIDEAEFCEKKQQTEAKPVETFTPVDADEDLPFQF